MVSDTSALLRKKVCTTSSSYSRRLAGVSGMIVTVWDASTRLKVARGGRDRVQRIVERCVPQVDR